MARTIPEVYSKQGNHPATNERKDLELFVDANFAGNWDPKEWED
jgi:hypothetical protein